MSAVWFVCHTFQAWGMKAMVVSAAAELPVQSVIVMVDIDCFAGDDYSVAANCRNDEWPQPVNSPRQAGKYKNAYSI
jgi:hypothetical protein